MGVSVTRFVKYIRKGEPGADALNIVVTNENIVFTDIGQIAKVYVEVFKGEKQLNYGSADSGFLCGTLSSSGSYICNGNVYWSFSVEDGKKFVYSLILRNKVAVNEEIPFTVTTNGGVVYNRSLNVNTAFDGEEGNGIKSQTSLFVASNKSSGVTHDNTSGWDSAFIAPTQQKPYIWKCVQTTYTQTGVEYSAAELVAVWQNGANPNLLDNAAFTDDNNLNAWTTVSTYVAVDDQTAPKEKGQVNKNDTVDGRNSFYDTCKYIGSRIAYKDVLSQIVHDRRNGPQKLVTGQWYTFSFWAKGYQQTIFVNQSSSDYGFARKELYLTAGRAYTISAYGYIDATAQSEGKVLRIYVWKDGWEEQKYFDITTTSGATKSMFFTPQTTGVYHLTAYMYDNTSPRTGSVYLSWYKIADNQDLCTYIYPSAVDTSVKAFVDGVETSLGADLGVTWKLGSSWTKHTVSFKTKSLLAYTDAQSVLFRLLPTPCAEAYRNISICMPKLEIGMMATGFIDTHSDVKGDRGPALRGPQAWSDCLNGYAFQAGGDGEDFKDVVLYNGSYYSCIKSHYKTDDNHPPFGSTGNGEYWELGDKIELVATKILLATYALVKNLGVEAIDMKDSNGNVIFQAKDGNVICNSGTFNDITVKGNIEVSQMRYKIMKDENVENGYIFYGDGGQLILPELKADECMSFRILAPVLRREPTLLNITAANDNVRIANSGDSVAGLSSSMDLAIGAAYDIVGLGSSASYKNKTVWYVFRLAAISTE